MVTRATENEAGEILSLSPATNERCYCCGDFARSCTDKGWGQLHCFQCGGIGHPAQNCVGNASGGRLSVPPAPQTRSK